MAIKDKLKDYYLLVKFNLTFMVVFSAVISYLLAPNISYDLKQILLLFLGGFLVTSSANAINQVVEKDTDAGMKRTSNRPVAAGRMSENEGWMFSIIAGAFGVFILWNFFNMSAALLALFSLFLYAFIYTPLKKINSISVLIGAVPGALPCLIGWVAGADAFSSGGWVLFMLQFFWQFPHFWAIAWLAHADYTKVGFKLLPSKSGPTKFTAMQAIMYSLMLIPVSLILSLHSIWPQFHFVEMSGRVSLIIVLLANFFMVWRCVQLYRKMDTASARRVMFGSYIYLPVVLLALLGDKIH